jgi:hypothetical protein
LSVAEVDVVEVEDVLVEVEEVLAEVDEVPVPVLVAEVDDVFAVLGPGLSVAVLVFAALVEVGFPGCAVGVVVGALGSAAAPTTGIKGSAKLLDLLPGSGSTTARALIIR